MPGKIRRPVPVQRFTLRRFLVPVPLHPFPKFGDARKKLLAARAIDAEILSRGQQTFHQKRGLHQIAGVIDHVEDRQTLRSVAIHKMRPDAVVSRRAFEETYDALHARQPLFAGDESAFHANKQRHDSESAGAGGHDAVIAGNIFERGAGIRMRAVPVIMKRLLLQHGEQFVVAEKFVGGARGGSDAVRRRRLTVARIRGHNAIVEYLPAEPRKIRVARHAAHLRANGAKVCAVFRAINNVTLDFGSCNGWRDPMQIHVPLVTLGDEGLRRCQIASSFSRRRDAFCVASCTASCSARHRSLALGERRNSARDGRLRVDANFVEDQRVLRTIRVALGKNKDAKNLRVERMNRGGDKSGQRDLHLHPLRRRQIAGKFSPADGGGKISHHVAEAQQRQVAGRNAFFRVTPEIQSVAVKADQAIAKIHHANLRVPPALAHGLPREPQCIRRRQKNFLLHGKLAINHF